MNQFVTRKGFLTLVRRRIALNFTFSKHNECLENKNLRDLRLKLDSSKTLTNRFDSDEIEIKLLRQKILTNQALA